MSKSIEHLAHATDWWEYMEMIRKVIGEIAAGCIYWALNLRNSTKQSPATASQYTC